MQQKWKQEWIMKWIMGIMVIFMTLSCSMKAYASEEESLKAVRKELYTMLINTDDSTHDVLHYELSMDQIQNEWNDMIEEEGFLPFHTYGGAVLVFARDKYGTGYAKTVRIYGMDDGFKERYANVQKCVEEVKAATKGMSDMEKVLYCHDYIVDRTTYTKTGTAVTKAGGPLGTGQGVCTAYADAMQVLLRYLNVPYATVNSSDMSHEWSYVKINGSWYHLDATWDEHYSYGIQHQYFIRNDTEYQSKLERTHYNWKLKGANTPSTSSTYENWFVHDIKGRMFYDNGLWYYVDNKTGNIVSSKIDLKQSNYTIVVNKKTEGVSKLTVTNVESGILYYTADGKNCKKVISMDIQIEHKDTNTSGGVTNGGLDTGNIAVGLSWSNISSWRSGHYSLQTGIYQMYPSRICLNNYISAAANTVYQVRLSSASCNMLIREMTKDKKFIVSHNLTGGGVFETKSNTAYLAISLYMPKNGGATFATYESLFKSGITVGLTKIDRKDVNSAGLKWNSFGYWRSGHYSLQTGKYVTYPTRVCLNDYISSGGGKTYKVSLSDSKFHMLVREMTSQKTLIKSHDLTSGSTFTTTDNTAYLAISLYMPSKDSSAEFDDFRSVIMNGPALIAVQ